MTAIGCGAISIGSCDGTKKAGDDFTPAFSDLPEEHPSTSPVVAFAFAVGIKLAGGIRRRSPFGIGFIAENHLDVPLREVAHEARAHAVRDHDLAVVKRSQKIVMAVIVMVMIVFVMLIMMFVMFVIALTRTFALGMRRILVGAVLDFYRPLLVDIVHDKALRPACVRSDIDSIIRGNCYSHSMLLTGYPAGFPAHRPRALWFCVSRRRHSTDPGDDVPHRLG